MSSLMTVEANLCRGDVVEVSSDCSVSVMTREQRIFSVLSANDAYVRLGSDPYRGGRSKQVPVSSVTLLRRGNWYSWNKYQNYRQLSFMSYADEIAFWRDQELAKEVKNPADGKTDSWTGEQAIAALENGVADAFIQSSILCVDPTDQPVLVGFRVDKPEVAKRLRKVSLHELTHLCVS